jgi:hypothetical protein
MGSHPEANHAGIMLRAKGLDKLGFLGIRPGFKLSEHNRTWFSTHRCYPVRSRILVKIRGSPEE